MQQFNYAYLQEFPINYHCNYTRFVHKCPRNIAVHDMPDRDDYCGKECRATKTCAHTGWINENAQMYFVSYDSA